LTATFWWAGLRGAWFPGAHFAAALPAAAALTAWGMRHVPRALGGALVAATLAASAWLVVALWTGARNGWLQARTDAPWGPLVRAFPDFDTEPLWAAVVTAAVGAVLAVLAVREWRARRVPV
jgi:hypothetical protein